jgi:hypothetical protein
MTDVLNLVYDPNGPALNVNILGYSGATSGYSGYSGYSGLGISGYSGYSGYSGISGYSGYSGISGYSGYSGISGYSGYSGAKNIITVGVSLDGQNNVITAGSKGYRIVEVAGTISQWYVISDVAGTIQFDIKRSGTTIINAGNHPALSTAQRANATPATWDSVTVATNDELEFVVDASPAPATLTKTQLFIQITPS